MELSFFACAILSCALTQEANLRDPPQRVALPASQPYPTGAIARAVARDAGQLPVLLGAVGRRPTPPKDSRSPADWSRVTHLRPGTEVQLTTVGQPEGPRYVIRADALHMTVLDLTNPSLPSYVVDRLRDAAVENPEALAAAAARSTVEYARVRIGPDGLVFDGRRLGDATDVVRVIPRADVVQVSRYERRGSGWGALAGGLGGFLVGLRVGAPLAFKQCGSTCNDEKFLMGLSLIGIPIGGGFLGYQVAHRTVDTIGYRAAPAPGAGAAPRYDNGRFDDSTGLDSHPSGPSAEDRSPLRAVRTEDPIARRLVVR